MAKVEKTKTEKYKSHIKKFQKENGFEMSMLVYKILEKEIEHKFFEEIVKGIFDEEDMIHQMIKDYTQIHWDWEELFVNKNIYEGFDKECICDIVNALQKNPKNVKPY
ncbi:MAG: hypothetical protein M0P91_04695 [Sulfuricurvum sp.]|uniref:hypothetical protein n=1 Tax=Sulfuricurvum sp. TaxID=2025608 RepID=UPI0025E72CB7|nr:hypothetical protein [Sulfuricurvum sp.]MCK9372474.1 hypothetical protein [Sulfuricurvum sp.]